MLPVDPINSNYSNNTLELDYGICKRRIRAIEGRLRERWIFTESPGADVRIVHNHSGKGLRLGEFAIDDDVEIVPLVVFQEAEYPFEISASSTFYPDAHEESATVDGSARHTSDNTAWDPLQAAAGLNAWDDIASGSAMVIETGSTSLWKRILRSIFLFDVSSLSGEKASAATFSLMESDALTSPDNCSISPTYNIFESAPASNTAVVAGDFDSPGTTEFSSDLAHGSIVLNDYNPFVLNSPGLTFLQAAIDGDGIVKLGFRESTYDAPDSEPARNGNSLISKFSTDFSDRGSGYKPKLVVESSPLMSSKSDVLMNIWNEDKQIN